MNIKEINVKIKNPLKYAYEGQMTSCEFILIKKPTARQISLTAVIRSIFQANMMEQVPKLSNFSESVANAKIEKEKIEKEGSKESIGFTANEALTILYLNPENVEKLVVSFSELLRSGLFLLDGETPLTKPLIDQMDAEDFDHLFGSFVANFTFASLMKG